MTESCSKTFRCISSVTLCSPEDGGWQMHVAPVIGCDDMTGIGEAWVSVIAKNNVVETNLWYAYSAGISTISKTKWFMPWSQSSKSAYPGIVSMFKE